MDKPITANINFLRVRKKAIGEQEVKDRKYSVWMTYLTVLVGLVAVVVLGADIVLRRQIDRVREESSQAMQQIQQHQAVESELLALAEKLAFIENSLQDKEKKREAIAFFTQQFSTQESNLREITFGSEGVLEFQLVSKNIFVLQSTVAALQSPAMLERYRSVTLSDISRDVNGAYRMQVNVAVLSGE